MAARSPGFHRPAPHGNLFVLAERSHTRGHHLSFAGNFCRLLARPVLLGRVRFQLLFAVVNPSLDFRQICLVAENFAERFLALEHVVVLELFFDVYEDVLLPRIPRVAVCSFETLRLSQNDGQRRTSMESLPSLPQNRL